MSEIAAMDDLAARRADVLKRRKAADELVARVEAKIRAECDPRKERIANMKAAVETLRGLIASEEEALEVILTPLKNELSAAVDESQDADEAFWDIKPNKEII